MIVASMRLVVLSVTCWSLVFAASRAPRFSEYPAAAPERGKPAAPRVPPDSRDDRGYRAVLTDAEKPANFASHYRISEDNCGSDSVLFMSTDIRSGRVYGGWCFFWSYRFGLHPRPDLPKGIEYRLNSRLLIAHGCLDADDPQCGSYYFEMTSRGLVLIRRVPFNPPLPGVE
jgi:hypothetical protein